MMKQSTQHIMLTAALLMAASLVFSSCEKVSPTGVLIGNTSVDDRVKQSLTNYSFIDVALDKYLPDSIEEYSFLVGSDSHITIDPGRLSEMLEIGADHGDLFYCHLGDLADTKPEYYYNTQRALNDFKYDVWIPKFTEEYVAPDISPEQGYIIDPRTGDIDEYFAYRIPFYPVAGNHDITHNGWSLFCNLFKTSFYEFTVKAGNCDKYDRFIFLDSANGTLGNFQIDEIENGIFQRDKKDIRYTFTFTHTNIFRPILTEFASTYCREELYFLLNKLSQWNTTIAFWGHVHAWDDRKFDGVRHITMHSMNFVDHPNGGDNLLVRVTVKPDTCIVEPVGLYCKQRSVAELDDEGFYVTTK